MELLQHCRDYAQQYYGDLLAKAEKTLADQFFKQAERCKSNEEQRLYFESSQQLEKQGEAMLLAFQDRLRQHYDTFFSSRDKESSIDEKLDTHTLSLVDRDELEDELAVSVIVSKSNSRNAESLWKLNRRLAVLRGGKHVSDETNPFGPTLVCNALQTAVNALRMDNKIKIIVYKHLGKVFVEGFTDILETLNTLLIDKGILPNLHFSLAKTGSAQPAADAGTQQSATDAHSGETAKSIAHQQMLYNAIKQLQAQSGPRTHTVGGTSFAGITTGATDAPDTFSPVDYALALSAIQQSRAFLHQAALSQPLETQQVEQKLFGQLLKQADKQGRHKIAQDHADTVDLVGLIFRYMLDDPNLHDRVKSLLSHLHTPYLKLALMDKSFINNYNHSARQLLNQMTEVGGRWVKEDNNRNVLPVIKKNVEVILREFIDDTSLFDELLDDFIQFKDNLEKRARMVEKRNTESQQGLERLELSKSRANEEVEQRLHQANISAPICQLLQKPWAGFLAFNLLRHGEKSLAWRSALKVVDSIASSIKADKSVTSKKEFQRRHQSLEQSVNEGLQTIGYDQQATKELLTSLKEAYKLAFLETMANEARSLQSEAKTPEKKPAAPENTSLPDPLSLKVQPANVRPPNVNAKKDSSLLSGICSSDKSDSELCAEENHMLATLKDIAFGTWFEFNQGAETVRLKLAWFSRITSHYMFVDHSGVKQKVETQHNLARGMCAGTIAIVVPDEKSFMERALEAVLDTLQLRSK